MKYLIITSPTTESNVSQASIFYLANMLKEKGCDYEIMDLSGTIDYFNPPHRMFGKRNKDLWLSTDIFNEDWIDKYIPEPVENYDVILCSALFSMDIIIFGRYVKKCKELNNNIEAVVGGAALRNLNGEQLEVIKCVFDKIVTSDIFNKPDYTLFNIKDHITVSTGYGCDWGKCRFCNSDNNYSLRDEADIINDFKSISELSDAEIMLSSDSFSVENILSLAKQLKHKNNGQKYNIMMRADRKIDENFASHLYESGCTDIFLGMEILDDEGLRTIKKGISVDIFINTAKGLHNQGIKVLAGLILFLPSTQKQLDNQLLNIEKILPYVDKIDLETLSIVYGSDFYKNHNKYGMELFPKENPIFNYWCYGLSPDTPWTFKDRNQIKMWLDHSDKLEEIIYDYVDEQYWWSIEYIRGVCNL